MTYQVLARKWRPATFAEMVGQGHVLKTLSNALDKGRLHHAYLFTGTRGVGKTTVARILAKCLNCESGISAAPCGHCSACTEISEGRFIDLIEVDAASRTKVEDTRELLDNVQYTPSRGRYKIYLIDEVHMLSTHSFNALLKTLEEPPPHVKFLLATTDPQKLPVTILSRCLQFNLKNLSPQFIWDHLAKVLAEEKIGFESEALWHLSGAAQGSMRDALTLLDQAISYCDDKLTSAAVEEMLGTPGQRLIFGILEALAHRSAAELLSACARAAEHGPDYALLMDGLMSTLHRIALARAVPGGMDNSFGDLDLLREFAGKFPAEDLQLYYQMCIRAKSELAFASDPAAMFEMLMLRMLVFSLPVSESGSKAPQDEMSVKKKPEVRTPSINVQESGDALPRAAVTVASASTSFGKQDEGQVLARLDAASWLEVFGQIKIGGITGNILANCVCLGFRDGVLKFTLQNQQSALYSEEHRIRIREVLQAHFRAELDVNIEIGDSRLETPAARDSRIRQEQYQVMLEDFRQDARVKQLVERFSGIILEETIVPNK